jgi:nucleotide-binding universal stress UspA family protein
MQGLEDAMDGSTTVVCPVDFSESSAGALRYAAVIASATARRLVVVTVEDPLLTEAVDLGTGIVWSPDECRKELERFTERALRQVAMPPAVIHYEVAVGKPAAEILRVAREQQAGLLVMSTHGLTGMRKLFFGSTTERVLRETNWPVLVTPAADPGPSSVDDARRRVRRILVPVDLTPASEPQIKVARQVAERLEARLMLVHVLEPVKTRLSARLKLAGIEGDRRAVAEDRLNELATLAGGDERPEVLVCYGDPAEELARIAQDRKVGLIFMGLHGSPVLGPRMGSVTYRLLCLSPTLTLALPPRQAQGDAPAVAASADPQTA